MKKEDRYGIRKHKDLKVVQSHIYKSYGGDVLLLLRDLFNQKN